MTKHHSTDHAAVDQYLSVSRAASLLDCSTKTIRRMITNGDLTAVRMGSGVRAAIRIPAASVNAALREVTTVGTIRAFEGGESGTPGGVCA